MATNIFGGRANLVHAKVAATFASMGLDATNTNIIYEIGATTKSWKPGRSINGITGTTIGAGYYFVAVTNLDKSTQFSPPFDVGSGTSAIGALIDSDGGILVDA